MKFINQISAVELLDERVRHRGQPPEHTEDVADVAVGISKAPLETRNFNAKIREEPSKVSIPRIAQVHVWVAAVDLAEAFQVLPAVIETGHVGLAVEARDAGKVELIWFKLRFR